MVSHSFCLLNSILEAFWFLTKCFKMDSMYNFHTRTIVFLFLESYLEICVCVCVHVCEWVHVNDWKSVFSHFDECIWMTETVWFHTVWNTIIYWWMYVNYWNKFCLHTKFDVVNPIIKVFGLLIAWKFARMKMHCNFQSVIIIFSFLESGLKIITYLVDVFQYLKQNGFPQFSYGKIRLENILGLGKMENY